jgi:hypothetical protein
VIIIRISFERVLRNVQTNLLLKATVGKTIVRSSHDPMMGMPHCPFIVLRIPLFLVYCLLRGLLNFSLIGERISQQAIAQLIGDLRYLVLLPTI